MERPISLQELLEATKHLAKSKMLVKDSTPIEFFLVVWEDIGPLLLAVLQGLRDGSLHPQLIVLLPKQGGQLFITNKRGLTLLNCGLKSLTKLFQLRISRIFQEYI